MQGGVGIFILVSPPGERLRRGFRRLRAATYFAHGGKVGKTPPGTRPMDYGSAYAPPRSIGPLTPDPITGVTPWVSQRSSGAQNLSDCSKFPPGHWALGFQNLHLLQFNFRAWVFEPTRPVRLLAGAPRGSPTQVWESSLMTVGDGLAPPLGGSGTRPYEITGTGSGSP